MDSTVRSPDAAVASFRQQRHGEQQFFAFAVPKLRRSARAVHRIVSGTPPCSIWETRRKVADK
jgi:hypothetical protein